MYKVLIFGMTENPGGVESFLLNYYRKLDKKKIQFDFSCNSYRPVAYEEELLAMGGRTFHFPARSENMVEYRKKLKEFFSMHAKEYQAIWVNVCSLANIDYLKLAAKYGIAKRIIHSHNSQNMDSRLRGILHNINKKLISKYATDFWACSKEAAKWFYTKKVLPQAQIIHNAIDVERMSYDESKRIKYRKSIACEDKFLIGNVGRLHFQKNQMFLLDIFQKVAEQDTTAELVLIGQGEDEAALKQKAMDLHIEEKVHFMGMQQDIPGWLSAFDLFLFPSVFEGLSIAALEAEANGIAVLASVDVIPEEIRINSNFIFCSLNESAETWAKKVMQMKSISRMAPQEIKYNFRKRGYDITEEVHRLEKMLV